MPFSSGDAPTALADYKTYAKISGTDAVRDAQIAASIAYIVSWAEQFTGRTNLVATSASTSCTETLDGTGWDSVILSNTPVNAITSVSLVDSAGTSTALTSTTYRVDSQTGVLKMVDSINSLTYTDGSSPATVDPSPNFPAGFQNVVVVYTYGVASYATISPHLLRAIFRAVDRDLALWGVRDANDNGRSDAENKEYFEQLFTPYRENVAA